SGSNRPDLSRASTTSFSEGPPGSLGGAICPKRFVQASRKNASGLRSSFLSLRRQLFLGEVRVITRSPSSPQDSQISRKSESPLETEPYPPFLRGRGVRTRRAVQCLAGPHRCGRGRRGAQSPEAYSR